MVIHGFTLLAFTAPLLVVGIMGMIIGPAIYGFVLAAFRTWIYFKEIKVRDDKPIVLIEQSLQQGVPPIV